MNDVQRNFLTAGIVCAASASLIGGIYARQKVEDDDSRFSRFLAPGLVASRSTKVEVPEERYFYDLAALLRKEYVDPIGEDVKLASGSVKGMISSLDDERSLYMSAPVFRAVVNSMEGKYEGIGATLVLSRNGAKRSGPIRTSLEFLKRVPRVRVAYIVPGGPADEAGLKPGDEIESIDGRWVVNSVLAERFQRVDAQVKAKKLPETARMEIVKQLREKSDNSMMPVRAIERLVVGEEGVVQLEWRRGDQVLKGSAPKAKIEVPVNEISNGRLRLAFVDGAAEKLGEALKANSAVVLDLRGTSQGDYREMLECLGQIVPPGDYGKLIREGRETSPVKVLKGVAAPKPATLLVDKDTKGVAEIFALILKSKGSKLQGSTGGDPSVVERTSLPDGSGFTLRVGDFKPAGVAK